MFGQHRRLHTRGLRILEWVALLSLLRLQGARAQEDTAPTSTLGGPENPLQTLSVPTCTQADFLTDEQGLSPCLFLSNVMTKCSTSLGISTPFTISSVLNQSLGRYAPPERGSIRIPCDCTEATYNLFSACAACQVGDIPRHWTDHATWFANCPNQTQIPKTPSGTPPDEFDLWMTSVFTPSFNLTQAQDVTITGTPPSGDTVNGSSASGNTASSTSSSKKSNTPIIVGVVVGVVGLLALVALALFLIRRRQKKSRVPPSAEFMKYAQHDRMGSVNLPTSSHPLMGNMGTADDEEDGRRSRTNLRGSVIRLDGTDNSHDGTGGGGGTSGAGHTSAGMSGSTERDGAPPAFTPGLFKDPIFEKGVALNLAGMSGGGPASGSPVTYSPATPSSAAQNHQNNTEKQRLIQSRHGTA